MANELTLKEVLEVVKAVKNMEKGVVTPREQQIIENRFFDIPEEMLEKIKEKISWSIILMGDYGDEANMVIGKMIFSLKENRNFLSYRAEYLRVLNARGYAIPNDIIKIVIKDDYASEIYELFSNSSLQNRMNYILSDYIDECNASGREPSWIIISKVKNLSFDIIERFKEKLHWDIISNDHNLTSEFMFRFYDYIDIERIEKRIKKVED